MEQGEKIALRLLSRRWLTKRKLEEKLAARGLAPEEISSAICRMEELGYLNDERYAEAWLREKLAQGKWGPRRLKLEMVKQGIEPQLAEKFLTQAFPPDSQRERELALAVARRKARQLDWDPAWRSKTGAALARWGFSPEVIWRVLQTLTEETP